MKKKFLKILGIITLIVAIGGIWGYNKYFKPDPVIHQQLVDQFGEDFFSFEDIEPISDDSSVDRLDTLFSAAVQEYEQSKKEGKANCSQLVQKYIQAGTTLEENVDSQFYGALTKLEEELKAHNLATDIVKGYKEQYEKAKSAVREGRAIIQSQNVKKECQSISGDTL